MKFSKTISVNSDTYELLQYLRDTFPYKHAKSFDSCIKYLSNSHMESNQIPPMPKEDNQP